MGIDIKSLLMGKAMGGGGGSGGSVIQMHRVGAFGTAACEVATGIQLAINGYNGKYALISVCHRDTLTAPSGCILLDKSEFTYDEFTQYVSLYKMSINSDSLSLTFNQASSARIGATAWVADADFSLSKISTGVFGYYMEKYSISAQGLTFFTFNAPTAQNQYTNIDVAADADCAMLCQIPTHHYYKNGVWGDEATFQLRHFTGLVFPNQTTKVWQKNYANMEFNTPTQGQIVAYTISAA